MHKLMLLLLVGLLRHRSRRQVVKRAVALALPRTAAVSVSVVVLVVMVVVQLVLVDGRGRQGHLLDVLGQTHVDRVDGCIRVIRLFVAVQLSTRDSPSHSIDCGMSGSAIHHRRRRTLRGHFANLAAAVVVVDRDV